MSRNPLQRPGRHLRRLAWLALALVVLAPVPSTADLRGATPPPPGWETQRSPVTGLLTYLSGPRRGVIPVAPSEDPLAILRSHGALFGVRDPARELTLLRAEICILGDHHHRYQQTYGGIPVFTGQLIVHQHPDGTFTCVNGDFYPIALDTPTEPTITADDALFLAGGRLGGPDARPELAELVIVDPGWYGDAPLGTRLAWKFIVLDREERAEHVLVDATLGEVLDRWSAFPNALNRRINDGTGQGGGNGPAVRLEGDPATGDAILDAGYDFAGDTYRLLMDGFGRDSIDGNGMTMRVTGHWESSICPNATWNGARARFCDGLLTDDIVAHEFFHGVTGTTANLIYQNQSGMLNESFSDVFGELVDLWNGDATVAGATSGSPSWPAHPTGGGLDAPNDARVDCGDASLRWKMGEESTFGHIRDMFSPNCRNHPAKVNDAFYPCIPAIDNGGVHIGSGVPNHAFAMLVDGKTFEGTTVNAIGAIRAGSIWFRALTVYLTPASDFVDSYPLFLQAGNDLVGATLGDPRTGGTASETITTATVDELDAALIAVGLNDNDACGAAGPPPANDECVDAIAIGPGITSFDTITATNSTAPYPDPSLCDQASLGDFAHDIWFSFTPPADGFATFTTCDQATFDTDLAIYTGDCGALTSVACNGDTINCQWFTSTIFAFPVTGSTEYTVRLGSWGEGQAYTGDLEIDYSPTSEICNNGVDDEGDGDVDCADSDCAQDPICLFPGDRCIEALPVGLGANAFDTTGASVSFDDVEAAACSGTGFASFAAGDTWYTFTPADTGILTISTCGSTGIDTDLALYTGSCGNLTTVACNGDGSGCPSGTSVIDAVVFAGIPLTIRLGGGALGEVGTGTLSLSLDVPVENCANGIDDDFDGSTDCIDPDCVGSDPCVCDPITAFSCVQGLGTAAELTWTNGEPYSSITVRRDGQTIATLAGTATSYSDPAATAGARDYQLLALCGTLQTVEACAVTIEDPTYFTMTAETTTVAVPNTSGFASFEVGVSIAEDPTTPGFPNATQGFSLGLSHDPTLATATGFTAVGALAALNGGTGPDFANVGFPAGGFTVGVVYSLQGLETIALSGSEELLVVSYDTVPGAFVGFAAPVAATWSFTDTLGVPPVETVMVVGGGSLVVEGIDGLVTFEPELGTPFRRGDSNDDGLTNIADAITSLEHLFFGGVLCLDSVDCNDDGTLNIADPIYLLAALFSGGPAVPDPTGACGLDPTDDSIGCDSSTSCN